MTLRVLENNVEKSMKYNIEFNRERGFEVTKKKHAIVGPGCSREYLAHMPFLSCFIRNGNQLTLLIAATIRRLI